MIYKEGDECDFIYFIVEGQVSIYKKINETHREDKQHSRNNSEISKL